MQMHLKTGNESLINVLPERGLAISRYRLRTIAIDIANSVIAHWEKEGVVVPPQAVKNVFTVGAIDSIDWDPTPTTSKSESVLHGTSISIHQLFSSPVKL